MIPEFKPLAQELLQARLDHHLETPEDFIAILGKQEYSSACMVDTALFLKEIALCGIIPEARKVAEKYGLTLAC
jgi:hypothetical protein